MTLSNIRILFLVAGLYDFIIGLAFLLFGVALFNQTGVPLPSHWGYIQFASLMLLIFGVMFLAVSFNPVANRNLIPYGVMLKISYSGLVGYYWITSGCPMLFKPFFFIDLLMLAGFVMAYFSSAIRPSVAHAENK